VILFDIVTCAIVENFSLGAVISNVNQCCLVKARHRVRKYNGKGNLKKD
jgi:hypothetical protein